MPSPVFTWSRAANSKPQTPNTKLFVEVAFRGAVCWSPANPNTTDDELAFPFVADRRTLNARIVSQTTP
jgi:hypothetical protein